MVLVITGSEGNIGRRLKNAYPGAIGIDRRDGADIVADLADANWAGGPLRDALARATALVHLATSADPHAAADQHFAAVTGTARLVEACAQVPVPRLVLASSDWAAPTVPALEINAYGRSKQVIEAHAAMYRTATGKPATALRIGWVPHNQSEVQLAPDWLKRNYWSDDRLLSALASALSTG